MPLAEKKPIALASDHAGFPLKEKVREYLVRKGMEVHDFGTSSLDRVDYPDYAEKVAVQVAEGKADCGILVCGTGLGMMLAANQVPGIRALPVQRYDFRLLRSLAQQRQRFDYGLATARRSGHAEGHRHLARHAFRRGTTSAAGAEDRSYGRTLS